MTIHKLLQEAQRQLEGHVAIPDLEARVLLSDTLCQPGEYLLTHPEHDVTAEQIDVFQTKVAQRCNGTPLAYVRGQQEFFGRDFHVRPGVLIPRPATELLITAALQGPTSIRSVADIGCGSGCISCTLAAERPNWIITAIDPSPIARTVTEENAQQLNVAGRVHVKNGNLLQGISILPDLIIANLPYLHPRQLAEPSITTEPLLALDGGEDGLELITTLIEQLANYPRRPTGLILECDPSQVASVARLVNDQLHPQRSSLLGEEAVHYGLAAWWN